MGRLICIVVIATALAVPLRIHAEEHVLELVNQIGEECGWIDYVSMSPDGSMVAEHCGWESLRILSFPQGKLIKKFEKGLGVFLSEDWRYIVDNDSIIEFKSSEPLKNITLSPRPSNTSYSQTDTLSIDQDGRFLAVSSGGSKKGTRVIDLRTGKQLSAFGTHHARAMAFSPDGKILATAHYNLVLLRGWMTGKRVEELRGGGDISTLTFSHDGKLIATGTSNGKVQVWNLTEHRLALSSDVGGIYVSTPAFAPNDRLMAVGIYGTGAVWLFDVTRGNLIESWEVSDHSCGSVAFSPDGQYLVTASTNGLFRFRKHWANGEGKIHVFRIHNEALNN